MAQQQTTNKRAVTTKKRVSPGSAALTATDLGITERRSISPQGFSLWARSLFLGWRQGTVACKGRSDVCLSGKKPWKQKGTGRARAGTARSPLWRGGGVTFGPQPRTRVTRVSRNLRQGIKNALLWDYLEQSRIIALDWASSDVPKTSQAIEVLNKAGLVDKKITLFLAPDDLLTRASFSNIAQVNIVLFDEANAVNMTTSMHWVVLKKDMNLFKQVVAQWV